MKNNRMKLSQRVRYALLAGMAGAFLIPQVGFAAPMGEHDMTLGVTVGRVGSTTNIGGSAANNLIKWQDYSVANGETVAYDSKNYLNLVTGGNTSTINGTITGGGDIYLVNPNGVIFGKTASVNVGSLHVSTQNLSAVNDAAFTASGTSPINTTAAGLSDVVNMGAITATNVEVVGKNIRFLNAANVTSSNVVMYTDTADDGTAHIGYRGTAPTSGYTVNGAAATAADNYYQLVATTTEFQDINNDLTKNYMLENDIDFSGGALTPIGGNSLAAFTGKIDGNFYRVKNFTVSPVPHAGLFGKVDHGRIENLGVTGAAITGITSGQNYAGGIAAVTTGTTSNKTVLKNVYVKDTTVDGRAARHGGIVGLTEYTNLDSVYSKAQIGPGGGVIGTSADETVVSNTYSEATFLSNVPSSQEMHFIYIVDPNGSTKVHNSFSKGSFATNETTLTGANSTNTYKVNADGKTISLLGNGTGGGAKTAVASYSGWGSTINNDGAPGAKWRIYEGRTTPMLTAFMSGTATANYRYRYFNADGSVVDTSAAAVKQNNGADVTGLEYNSKYVKIVDSTHAAVGDKSNQVVYSDPVDLNEIHDYVNGTTKDFDKTNGVRNAGTKAILWADQDGPNLRGVNVTIDPREVKLTGGSFTKTRVYNGKKSVKDVFTEALNSGAIGTSGFTQDDKDDHSVSLNTSNFTADMADKNVVRNTDGTYGEKNVTFGGTITFSGDDAKNYTFDNSSISTLTGKVRITPAPLYLDIRKSRARDKIYDGTVNVADDEMKQSVSPKNIKLRDTIVDGTSDGTRMIDDGGTVDTVSIKNIADPTYTDASGAPQIHVGSHKLQYTNVGLDTATHPDGVNYDLYYTPNGGSKTKVTDEKLYLDGDIVRRGISRNSFTVYNSDNSVASATKPYDGTSVYTPGSGLYLSSNVGASTDPNEGIVTRDQGHITFQLAGGAYFTNNAGTRTKNVAEATKVAYTAKGHADSHTDTYGGHLLSDYYVLNEDGVTKDPLNGIFSASGAGKITPKTITATIKHSPITKVYDALRAHDKTGNDIITLAGVIAGDTVTNNSTAIYNTKDVVRDGGGAVTTQGVTYNVAFATPTAAEAQNYTFSAQATPPSSTPVTTTTTLHGLGTITPRPITVTFGPVTKIYDGTVTNTTKTVSAVNDGTGGVVLGRDSISTTSLPTSVMNGITSRYGNGTTAGTFRESRHAGSRTVEYTGLANAFGGNYTINNEQYGVGTITRRRIDPSGFQVYDSHGNVANATKVYDGNNRSTLAPGAYLTSSAPTPGNTGIVTEDYGKVTFALKTGTHGTFSSDPDGNNATSHVSEAQYVSYDIIARTSDPTNNPLSNYTFGSSSATARKLEEVNNANPAHVTASGSITPASIRATTHAVEKVYDGMAEHTDGNRNIQRGRDIVSLATMITDETDGQPTNTSTASYADKNVSRDSGNNIINKNVTYTAQLTGRYADDYQIVNAGNIVISSVGGSGANKTLTANVGTVTNAGKITPRRLSIEMADVSKTYDGSSENTAGTVSAIKDIPTSSVLNAILSGDGISAAGVSSAWQARKTANTATSNYGRGTGTAFAANANASNGTPHDVRYTAMNLAFADAATTHAGNYTVEAEAFGKGTINRKAITPSGFQVVDANGVARPATKVYDGTSSYQVPSTWKLDPPTGGSAGVIAADAARITFKPAGSGTFQTSANAATANTYDVDHVAYKIKAETAAGDEYLLKNYTLGGQNLESGNATVTGAGTITRRTLRIGLADPIVTDKVYDGNANLVDTVTRRHQVFSDDDGKANVTYAAGATNANKLVRTKNGYAVDDGAQVTVQGSYADKNVAYSGGAVTTKNITYNVKIAGNPGRNYLLSDGITTVNAENGMNLSATGKITPKDLSGAFKKVTKTYDGTTAVNPADVAFTPGAVISGDTVGLASGHAQVFESPNVRGSGTTWTAPNGTTQHNWVNYSNLSLTGADAGNYTLGTTAKGLGEIKPYQLNPNTVDFTIRPASKTYDGTRTVKYGSSSALSDVKSNYITGATVTIGSTQAPVLDDLKLISATYDTKDVDGGRSTDRVTYTLAYTGTSGNFSLGGNATIAPKGDGIITKKDVTATVKSPVTKVYDATKTVVGVAKNSANTVVANANDLIGMTGFTGNDGATYTTTARYADKNVGTGKRVDYTLTLNGAAAGNYNLKYNGANNSGAFSTNGNTITKRTVHVGFDPVSKDYDSTPINNTIAPKVSANDAAVLRLDSAGNVSGTNITNLTGVTSQYGTLSGGTFTPNPNAGAKTVRYYGVGTAMGTTFGANNYDFVTSDGTGTINKANINASDVDFLASNATKTYDGTKTVKYNGSSASNDVKNYITRARVQLNGNWVDLRNDLVMDGAGTQYSSANATNGTPTTVTYKFRLSDRNINISGGNDFTKTAQGTIDRRVLTLDLAQKTGIDKIYDANANLVDTNTRHYDKFIDDDAKGNVTYASGTTNDNKLVRTANGAAIDDGASMTITANYVNAGVADKNAGVNKDIAYNVKIGGTQGQNYTLSYNGTTANAETGLDLTGASGTIAKRKITLGFGDVNKMYDTTAVNAVKNVSSPTADNSDGRGAATLTADGITNATFNMAGVDSYYGSGNTDATFQRNPNVVTDADGNVISNGKDVQYTNLGGTLSGANANNYTVVNTAYGKGTIRKRTVSVNDFNFNISNATKEYDGTRDVEYVEGGKTYKDLPHLKKRFQTSTLDLGGGNTVPINLDDITLTGAKYNDERVAHATGINYDVTINAQNFEFNGGRDKRIEHTGDTITKRDLATKLPPHLVKEYDSEDSFTETNTVFANAMARANLTGVVDSDKNKIRLAVNGRYNSPDASTETREEAEARTPAQAGRNVHYDLTLSGDTDTLSNYKIGTVQTLDSDGKMRGVGSGKADIYKKTLTVGVDNIDKLYDGTRTVVRPNGTGTLPHPEAGKFRLSGFVGSESFSFDQTAADKIDGLYSDSNVSRRNGAVVDKDISYSGIKTAFANYAGRNSTGYAKNYRVDSDTLSGKGKILPRPITANEITNGLTFAEATKVYDGTTKVKYNGQNTPDALKNYLTSATVNVDGTPIDIKQDLTIRADEAYTHYDTQHVAGGAQPRVTYTLNYTGGNFDISGDLTKTANGVITKRKVTAFAPGQLTKVYDASEKVYDPRDTSIKTYRRGTRVTDGDSIVRMSTEDGDTGLLANDGVRNISTATFDDKNVGKRKKVTYNVAVDSTHAGDYEIVDTLGNTISELTTRNNEITPRRLDLTFGNVDKFYDGTSTNEDMPATRVTDSDTRRTLGRDRARIFNDELIMQDAAGNGLMLPSDYGYGSTDRSFTPDANANQIGEPDKSVQYRNMGDALRTILGDNAKNYEFDETGYGKGRINKANVRESDFRLNFKDAVREYDGTSNVDHAIDNLQDDSRWKSNKMLKSDIASVTGTYMSPNGSTPDKNAADRKIVDYKVRLNERNFDFGSWDGVVSAEGGGAITKRKIIAETPRYLTKEYDGTKDVVGKARDAEGNLVKQNGDGLITFRHYNKTAANKYDAADGLVAADTAGNTVRNATTALYADKNVAWKDGAWKNGHGTVDDMNVNYSLTLSGTDAVNYEIVDADGKTVNNTTGKGKITPKDIHLKADPQTRWINEGLPDSYTGTPSGSNYETGVNGEALPGEIYYDSPNGKLRWGDYAINGYYRASDKAQYQRPDGSRYQLADKDKTPDGDSVARNYRFVQDPANKSALHIGPYIPDYEYYKAITQTSKMIPDEYAYENASLDRQSHFGRTADAEVTYDPPSINTVKDGTDIIQTGIRIADETVFSLVNEVFGAR